MEPNIIEKFMNSIKQQILYWDHQDRDSKGKLEGLAFSILCMLDGVSGSFGGSISELEKMSRDVMLHECFYKKGASDEKDHS
jgi:hypothetical protein